MRTIAGARLARREDGFTLIELLIVIGIIGVLAAIATPAYFGLTSAARDGSVRFDLANDKTAITAWSIDNNGQLPNVVGFDPGPAGLNLTGYGWTESADSATYRYMTSSLGASTTWCLEMHSSTSIDYRASTNTQVAEGTCAALGGANF